jgi:hypothetical protein
MSSQGEVIETTAGNVAAELARRGIGSNERVIVVIEPEQELIPGRRESRARVVAAGLTDDDIDRLVKQLKRRSNRPLDEGRCRHKRFCERGPKGPIPASPGGDIFLCGFVCRRTVEQDREWRAYRPLL